MRIFNMYIIIPIPNEVESRGNSLLNSSSEAYAVTK
jgi:hypothetical protein